MGHSDPEPSRRDFLAGRALRDEIVAVGQATGDALFGAEDEPRREPTSGATIRLATAAMATDFAVILNEALPDDPRQPLRWASEALDVVHLLEDQLSVYRPNTELSQLNQVAASHQSKLRTGCSGCSVEQETSHSRRRAALTRHRDS